MPRDPLNARLIVALARMRRTSIPAACVAIAAAGAWVIFNTTAVARPVQLWTMDSLRNSSDLVIVGEVEKSTDLDADKAAGDIKVATTVRVGVVLSGEPIETIRLIHYRKNPSDDVRGVVNEFSYLNFEPDEDDRKATTTPFPSNPPVTSKTKLPERVGTQYLMFLKRNESGDAEPVSGQADPEVSVFRLTSASDSGASGLLLRRR